MQRFKRIILPMQGHSKSDLHWLYNTRSDFEPPLINAMSVDAKAAVRAVRDIPSLIPEAIRRFYEDIRPIDAFCCVNRMRGVHFKKNGGDRNE